MIGLFDLIGNSHMSCQKSSEIICLTNKGGIEIVDNFLPIIDTYEMKINHEKDLST